MITPTIYWIDLFCGAGGTTTGIHLAEANAIVLACVNHDAKAIAAHQSKEVPAGTLTNVPKLALVNIKQWLLNPQFASKGSSIEDPCFTLIARMDKKPPYIVSAETGEGQIIIYEDENPVMVKIKMFMAENGIVDIKMRMLLVDEMLLIQGFPADYKLEGTQTDQKKFIGNSVVPLVAQRLVEANADALREKIMVA